MAKSTRKFNAETWTREAARAEKKAQIKQQIRRGTIAFSELARRVDTSTREVRDIVQELKSAGLALHISGDKVFLEPGTIPPPQLNEGHTWKGSVYRFGAIGDTHYGSKYAREDITEDLYDWFAREGIERVYHTGNWIDGEKSFNKQDLIPQAHGMQAQLDYFVANYPQRKGIKTFIVSGDDHEGWYCSSEGVDIGQMMEDCARNAGRKDLFNLGYMTAFTKLIHEDTGRHAKLLTAHPGGGSAYATSYAIQKIAEGFDPGQTPAVALFGHYHKLEYLRVRGCHAIQTGCTKGQDAFGWKKKLSYHLGGVLVEVRQAPNGKVTDCIPWFKTYGEGGHFNDRFSHSHTPARIRS